MATIKGYTDIEQSNKLADILPLESADMVLPFRHTKNNEYIPGYVVSRNYVEVYNEMMKLPGMGKEDICQLTQPAWSLAALLEQLKSEIILENKQILFLHINKYNDIDYDIRYTNSWTGEVLITEKGNLVDACYEMIVKIHELNLL